MRHDTLKIQNHFQGGYTVKRRRQKRATPQTVPVSYPHKVEAWLQATACAIRGSQLLTDALLAQQKYDCEEQAPTIEAAEESFDKARWWLKASREVTEFGPDNKAAE